MAVVSLEVHQAGGRRCCGRRCVRAVGGDESTSGKRCGCGKRHLHGQSVSARTSRGGARLRCAALLAVPSVAAVEHEEGSLHGPCPCQRRTAASTRDHRCLRCHQWAEAPGAQVPGRRGFRSMRTRRHRRWSPPDWRGSRGDFRRGPSHPARLLVAVRPPCAAAPSEGPRSGESCRSRRLHRRATRSLVLWAEVAVLQVAGVFLIVLGWSILVTLVSFSAFLPIAAVHLPVNEILLAFPAIVALAIVYLTACSLVARTGRRLRITAAALANQARARPFVLYLRSWVDDRGMVASGGTEWWRLAEFFPFRARIAMDEVVARELGKSSSVISLAEPAAPRFYVPLGAAQRHVSGDQWRQYVLDRMDEAALIVISIGTSDALLWELGMATKRGHLARLVMVMPPAADEDARLRWKASANAIAEAGGPLLGTVADPSSVVLARVSETGIRQVLVVDQLDESAYSVAFTRLLAVDPIPTARRSTGWRSSS